MKVSLNGPAQMDRLKLEPTSKLGWGVIRLGGQDYDLADLLHGIEGRIIPAELRPILVLLREYKSMSRDVEHYKHDMTEALHRAEQAKQSIIHMQEYLNSFEEAVDKLVNENLIDALLKLNKG